MPDLRNVDRGAQDAQRRLPLSIEEEITATVPEHMQRLFVGIVRVCSRDQRVEYWLNHYIRKEHHNLFKRAVAAERDENKNA